MGKHMHRRHVIGLIGCGAAATALGGYRLLRPGHSAATTPAPTLPRIAAGWTAGQGATQAAEGAAELAIVRNGEPAALVDAAFAALGGMGKFVSKGAKVLVKPNIGWDRSAELGANTNPEVVARIVQLCLDAGAKRVVVMDRTCNDPRRCYVNSGIQSAAEDAGAKVFHVDDARVTRVDLGGEVLHEWDVYDEMMDVDVRINAPVAKHHMLSKVSLGMKNWMGCVGGNRSRMHQQVHKSVVDLAAYFKPAVTVLDAYRVLKTNGPQGGRPSDTELTRTLCASADPVAVDAFGASLFGMGSDDLRSVVMGEERGLGKRDLTQLATREIDLGA